MPFVKPMLATASCAELPPGDWVAEEKLDGHRLIVEVGLTRTLFDEPAVTAWSRNGIVRDLPAHVLSAVMGLPPGLYDGEVLVPGARSYGTAALANAERQEYVVFDLLALYRTSGSVVTELVTYGDGGGAPQRERRAGLERIFEVVPAVPGLRLISQCPVRSIEEVDALARVIWERDGEGMIVKRQDSVYLPGKRSRDWFKVKKLLTACVTLVGYREGKLGPQSVMILRDDEGNETACKWKNMAMLAEMTATPDAFIGRRLVIEYQERTLEREGAQGYRHPRFDHWEEQA